MYSYFFKWILCFRSLRTSSNSGKVRKGASLPTTSLHFLFHCPKYSIPREKFYDQIQQNFVDFDQLSYTELIIKLMNSQNFSVNSHLLKFVSLCNDLRNNLLSSHADDTWLTTVIIALSLLWFVCLFVCLFFFMLKLLQYCNHIIIVMQIKLMLLLLLCTHVYPSNTVYMYTPAYIFCKPMFTLVMLYTLDTPIYPMYPCLP